MAWNVPGTSSIGEVLRAAKMNAIRESLLETAPAIVTTAGDIVQADGANSLVRLALPASPDGEYLRARAGGAMWEGLPFDLLEDLDATYSHTITTPTIPLPSTASLRGTLPAGATSMQGLTYDGTRYVAIEGGGIVWTFTDIDDPGSAVEQGTLPAPVFGAAWDGSEYVFVSRTANNSIYTLSDITNPSGAVRQGSLPNVANNPSGMTWDGLRFLIVSTNLGGRRVWSLADKTSPGDAVELGFLPTAISNAGGITFDGVQYNIVHDAATENLYTLQNFNSPANAVDRGEFPSDLSTPEGITWDGTQLVIVHSDAPAEIWTLAPQRALLTTFSTTAVSAGTLLYDIELDADSVTGADVIVTVEIDGKTVDILRAMGDTVSSGPTVYTVSAPTNFVLRLYTVGAAAGSCSVTAKMQNIDTS